MMARTTGLPIDPTRRGVVAAAGGVGLAAALTACGSGSKSSNASSNTSAPMTTESAGTTATTSPSTSSSPSDSASAPAAGATVLGKTSDIPVGGGKIFNAQQVVVTQPTAGQFKAFSAVCTHQGCLVTSVSSGTINCPCHHSMYKVADGSVVSGPAPAPLPPKQVTVSGDKIELA